MRRPLLMLGLAVVLVAATAAPAVAAPTAPDRPSTPTATPPPPPPSPADAPPRSVTPGGKPPPGGAPVHRRRPEGGTSAAAAAAGQYFYGGAFQSAVADGAYGSFNAWSTQLSDPGAVHSLVELAAESADGKQIIEVGLTVSRSLNGESTVPHLFVFHWVDGAASCYNGCGFVRVANSDPYPNMPVADRSSHQLLIQHLGDKWWVGDFYSNPTGSIDRRGSWFGYFPDSLWGGRFTKTGMVEWFGEVHAETSSPCTDMGTGKLATEAGSAGAGSFGFFNGPAVNYFLNQPNRTLYSADYNGLSFIRYGGPGAC